MSVNDQINLWSVTESEDSSLLDIVSENAPKMNELFLLNKEQNEELEKELAELELPQVPDQEITKLQPSLEKLQKQLEHESLDLYQDDKFDEASFENPESSKNTTKNVPKFRSRLMSGDNLDVLEVNENNSFLLGNERETQHFEAFVADKLFS